MLLKRIIVWRTFGCERGKTSYYIKVTVMCSALTLNWYADIYICTVSCSRGSMCKQTFNNALNSLDLLVYRRILIWPLKIYHYSRIWPNCEYTKKDKALSFDFANIIIRTFPGAGVSELSIPIIIPTCKTCLCLPQKTH